MKMCRSTYAMILWGLLVAAPSAAKTPDWVQNLGRTPRYPRTAFLVGFGESVTGDTQGECLEAAKDQARGDIARQIQVNIESFSIQQQQLVSGKEDAFIRSLTKSSAALRLDGVEVVDTFLDPADKSCFALAVLNKQDAVRRMRDQIQAAGKAAGGYYQKARDGAEANPTQSLNDYLAAKAQLNLCRRQTGILLTLGGTTLGLDCGPDPVEINGRVEALLGSDNEDLDLALTRLAYVLTRAVDPKLRILVDQFRRDPGRYSGSLAWFLSEGLESRLVQPCGYRIVDRNNLTGQGARAASYKDMDPNLPEARGKVVDADAVLYGHYREAGDKVYVTACLTDLALGERLAKVDLQLNRAALESRGLSLAPENMPEELPLPRQIETPELVVNLWTDRGDGGVYRAGEKMYAYVKSNMDCYLRLVYTQADGSNVQIFPNAYDREDRIVKDKVYAFPDKKDKFEFEITKPFGAEILQVFASTEKLPNLKAEEAGGGLMLLTGARASFVAKTRGIKVQKRDALYAEASCVISTLPAEKE